MGRMSTIGNALVREHYNARSRRRSSRSESGLPVEPSRVSRVTASPKAMQLLVGVCRTFPSGASGSFYWQWIAPDVILRKSHLR